MFAGCASFALLAFTSSERDLEIIDSGMNDLDVSTLYTEGQNLTVDEAVALALKE